MNTWEQEENSIVEEGNSPEQNTTVENDAADMQISETGETGDGVRIKWISYSRTKSPVC